MQIENGKATNVKIAYVGGGSRGWAWGLMKDLALEEKMSGTLALYDIDLPAAQQNQQIGQRIFSHSQSKSAWEVTVSETLEESLRGADFVVMSILPATYQEMESDVHAAEEYGIYQAVGDTVGPGGVFRALRTIPMYQVIAQGIRAHCPNAWVINYTNPMTVCTRALYEAFPEIKAFGCCHEVFGTQELLAHALKDMEGIADVPRSEILVNVKGINHFTWLDRASYRGRDLFPVYRAFIEKYDKTGFSDRDEEYLRSSFFASTNLVKFDLFKRYGLIAAAGDRHLAEFCPGWYIKNPGTVKRWGYRLTPVSFRVSELADRNRIGLETSAGKQPVEMERSGEEGVSQMKALLGLEDLITNVNLPNQGQIPSLPLGAVVETNAVFTHNSIRPVLAGPLPQEVNTLVYRHVANQEQLVKAGFQRNLQTAFAAFANDPLVSLSLDDAQALFRKMYQNTRDWLPDYTNLP